MGQVRRTGFRLATLAAATALLIGACSSGGGGSATSDDSDNDAGTTSQASGDPISLTLQHMETPPERVEAFQKVIDDFNASQDTYVVEQQTVGWGDAYTQAVAQIEAGQAPDMLQAIPAFMTTIRETGGVKPATGIFNNLAGEFDFLPSMVDQYNWEDEMWAIPAFGMVEGLWYNKAHFAEAGLEPPTTWSAMLAAAEALTKDGKYGVAVPLGDSFATLQSIYTWMGVNGGEDIYDEQCQPIVNTQNNVETFDFINKLRVFSPPDSVSYQWAEVENALVSGNASMITFKGSFLRGWLENSGLTAEDLGVVPIPRPDGASEDFSLSYSNAFMVMTDDAQKQAGIEEFMRFYLNDENYGEWLATAEPGLFLPVTTTATDSANYTGGEIISQFPDQMAEQVVINGNSALYGFTQSAYCPQVGEFEGQFLAAKAVERMIVNEETPEQAVAWLQAEMEAIG